MFTDHIQIKGKYSVDCDCLKTNKSDGTTYDLITEGNAILLNDFSYEEWHCDECDIDFGTCAVESIIEEF